MSKYITYDNCGNFVYCSIPMPAGLEISIRNTAASVEWESRDTLTVKGTTDYGHVICVDQEGKEESRRIDALITDEDILWDGTPIEEYIKDQATDWDEVLTDALAAHGIKR